MLITDEFKLIIAVENILIDNIDVYYKDGKVISGFLKEVKFIPFGITICKHKNNNEENYNHFLEFDKANKVKINYLRGKIREFV